ncbi:MAG TPA: zinc ABC transporter substrate-binding protein, partial [Pseudolysinimonas sp.]
MLKPVALLVAMVAALGLAGCTSTPPDNASDGVIRVVASTNVYGDIARTIGGADVEVTSVIDDPAQDPHEFEANARVQL